MVKELHLPELVFNEKGHTYELSGLKIPSVSEIMSPLSNDVYGEIDESVLEKAAARGTAVHEAIENYVKFGIEDIQPEYGGYFDAFLRWYKAHTVKPFGSEVRIYHKGLMYAGTADMAAEVDGVDTLVDFKTSSTVQHMLCGVQLEAYEKAWESHVGGTVFQRKAIVHLRRTGTYEMVEFEPNMECWKVFTALLTIRNYKSKF